MYGGVVQGQQAFALGNEAVGASVAFKGVEFDPIKVWVVDFFPEAEKIEG